MTDAAVVTRTVRCGPAVELYVTAAPRVPGPVERQAREVFSAVREAVDGAGAGIFQERVFVAGDAMAAVAEERAPAYGRLDDGVPPTWLAVPAGVSGKLTGVQVHAVGGCDGPRPTAATGRAVGRIVTRGEARFLAISSSPHNAEDPPDRQARGMLAAAESALDAAGADLHSVTRTWMWLRDILSWYDRFNDVRTEFFAERGLLGGNGGKPRLPASTAVGVAPADGGQCCMDLLAVVGAPRAVRFLQTGGKQGSAMAYGSAFARAVGAETPAGEAVYVSGTAAIDAAGRTVHPGDAPAQITEAVGNVRAVLADAGCGDADVVQAVAYCKTPAVAREFRRRSAELTWPTLVVLADICRDDLLFEIEATACLGPTRESG